MIFRRTDKFGYSRYYGGGGPAFVIKVVVTIALMVALVIGAAAFVVQKYMVYTENGGHLELPWEKETVQGDEDPGGLEGLVIEGEDSSQEPEASESAEESKSAEASESAEESKSAEASASAEASESEETPATPQSNQPGLWERFVNWLRSIFAAPQTSPRNAEASGSAAPSESEQGTGFWPHLSGDDKEEEQPAEESSASAEPEVKEPEKKEPLSGELLIQHVSMGDTKQGYAEGDIRNRNGNGLMLYMKESGGKLNFHSAETMAEELVVNSDQATHDKVKEVVADLKSKGYYTLAYLDGFQDQKAPQLESRLYDQGGASWYDGESRAWADPASETYQSYLIALVKELEELGFDEVVLNNAGYPSTGNTDILSSECYDPAAFRETVGGFYQKLAEATKDSECLISLITTETAVREGYDEATGQSLEDMLPLGGRIWVETDRANAQELSEALSKAGYPDNALGVLVSSLSTEDTCNQMNLD